MRSLSAIVVLLVLLGPRPGEAQVARFALVVGNNRGFERGQTLRFAERDAERVAAVLVELGGVKPADVVLLRGEGPEKLRSAAADLRRKIALAVPAKAPLALAVVYFSGHADGARLELGGAGLPFDEFQTIVSGLGAEVTVAFVDACQSGALVRNKGGRFGPSFALSVRDRLDARGTVILTSSGAGESSQESSALGGSFFTHFLLAGLRGAADSNADRQVTLSELYRFAYDRTMVETARTTRGAQHPAFGYQLKGRGEVVLSELGRGESALTFGPGVAGQIFVLQADTGEVLTELQKSFGQSIEVALPAGHYRVAVRRGDALAAQPVELARGDQTHFDPAGLAPEPALLATLKGGGTARHGLTLIGGYALGSGALGSYAALHQGLIGLRSRLGPIVLQARVSLGSGELNEPNFRFSVRLLGCDLLAAWRFELGALDLLAGASVGVSYGAQTLAYDRRREGAIFNAGGAAGLDVPVRGGLSLWALWEFGADVFQRDGTVNTALAARGAIGLGYEF